MEKDVHNEKIPSEEIEIIHGCVKSIGIEYLKRKRMKYTSNSRNVVTEIMDSLNKEITEEQCKDFESRINNLSESEIEFLQNDVTSLARSAQSKEALKNVESLMEIKLKESQNREAILDATFPLLTIFLTGLIVRGNVINAVTVAAVAAVIIAALKIIFEINKQSRRSIFNYVLITLKKAQEEK